MRNRIQIAFDLGSHSIKSAAGRILPNGKIEVLSIGEIQSKSIDCGDIVDKDLLLTHLEILVEKMEKDAKINIDEDAWVSVSGRGIKSINSSTRIRSRENTDFEINEEIKQKLLNQCSDVQVSVDRYVLHFQNKAPQAKPLCSADEDPNSLYIAGINAQTSSM